MSLFVCLIGFPMHLVCGGRQICGQCISSIHGYEAEALAFIALPRACFPNLASTKRHLCNGGGSYERRSAFKDVNSTGPTLRKMQRRYTASCWIVIISQKRFEKLSRTCFGEEVPCLLDPTYEGKRFRAPAHNKLPCPKVQISLRPSRDHIHFSGRQEQIRARSERALLHLQWTLAVDEEMTTKWKKALNKNELACERLALGSVCPVAVFLNFAAAWAGHASGR